MSARFEILVNGEKLCTSGIDGDGVLSAILSYALNPRLDINNYEFSVGSLNTDRAAGVQHHANWLTPPVGPGDEITIRILSPGEFDPPTSRQPDEEIRR